MDQSSGYRESGFPSWGIPPHADLLFEIEVGWLASSTPERSCNLCKRIKFRHLPRGIDGQRTFASPKTHRQPPPTPPPPPPPHKKKEHLQTWSTLVFSKKVCLGGGVFGCLEGPLLDAWKLYWNGIAHANPTCPASGRAHRLTEFPMWLNTLLPFPPPPASSM